MTQLESARNGLITREVARAAKSEAVSADAIRKGIASGTIVLPNNAGRRISSICAIGQGLRTKINSNIGTSEDSSSTGREIRKIAAACELGSDAVMDLSTGGDVSAVRRRLMAESPVPFGTVPIYQVAVNGIRRYGSMRRVPREMFFEALEEQAEDGVDFFTIHAGVTTDALKMLKKSPRLLGIVSRGGALLAEWMLANGAENPYYEDFDRVLRICRAHDITLSLGDGLRPGSIADATDEGQIFELLTLGELQERAADSGVQSMIEGPGHVSLNQVEMNVLLEKTLCNRAPFYVLGPLVTDVAPGYDHITAAIGGALAAWKGADFLCYVTPSEHLRLPSLEDVREGVIASKIAAHAADIAKGIAGAVDWDIAMSRARGRRDWRKQFKISLDKLKPLKYRMGSKPHLKDVCTMCGAFCSIKRSQRMLCR